MSETYDVGWELGELQFNMSGSVEEQRHNLGEICKDH